MINKKTLQRYPYLLSGMGIIFYKLSIFYEYTLILRGII